MADNLSISISADSTKLRADLAVAQAAVKDFATELRKSAAESLKSGDTEGVRVAAANYDEAASKAAGLRAQLQQVTRAHGEHLTVLQTTSRGLADVKSKAGEFGSAMSNMASSVFPRFKQVLELSVAGAVVELVKNLRDANKELTETRNLAATLGTDTGTVETFGLMFSKLGLDIDESRAGLAKFEAFIGAAMSEAEKGGAKAAAGVTILDGKLKGASASTVVLRAGMHDAASTMNTVTTVFSGGAASVNNYADALKKTVIEAARGAKAGHEVEAGFKAAGDFLSKIPDHFRQMEVGRAAFGRGFASMIPLLANFSQEFSKSQTEVEKAFGHEMHLAQERSKAYTEALGRAKFYYSGVKQIAFSSIGQGLVPLFNQLSESMTGNIKVIAAWSESAGKYLGDTVQDLLVLYNFGKLQDNATGLAKTLVDIGVKGSTAFRVLSAAFNGAKAVLDTLADALSAVLGRQINGEGLAAVLLIGRFSGVFAAAAAGARLFGSAMFLVVDVAKAFNAVPWVALLTAIAALALAIYLNWDTLKPMFESLWNLLKSLIGWVGNEFGEAWSKAVTAVEDLFTGLWNWIKGVFDKVIQAAKDAADWVSKAFSGGGGSDATAAKYAGGGYVAGAGTGTSDSILARVSNGEFVMRTAAVDHYGAHFFAALNRLAMPRTPGFALGGLVDAIGGMMPASIPAFAGGGMVTAPANPSNVINLTIGGETFNGLLAPDATATRMVRFARRADMRSGGTKPSWYTR